MVASSLPQPPQRLLLAEQPGATGLVIELGAFGQADL